MEKSKNNNNGLNQEGFVDELRRLEHELCSEFQHQCWDDERQPVLGVFKLFPGVDIEEWKKLSERHGLVDWLTLPVAQDALPHLKHQQELLTTLAYKKDHDPLTGLANRRAFERQLDLEIERARRNRSPVCLALLDVDDFKVVNDSYGHSTGDQVLQRMASVLNANKRRYDLASRYGGEEFALVLSGIGQVRAEKMLERLLEETRRLRFVTSAGEEFGITCSAGLSCYKGTVDFSVAEFVKLADEALYQAKNAGKDQLCRAPLPDVVQVPRETLVHAGEKKLLFGK